MSGTMAHASRQAANHRNDRRIRTDRRFSAARRTALSARCADQFDVGDPTSEILVVGTGAQGLDDDRQGLGPDLGQVALAGFERIAGEPFDRRTELAETEAVVAATRIEPVPAMPREPHCA